MLDGLRRASPGPLGRPFPASMASATRRATMAGRSTPRRVSAAMSSRTCDASGMYSLCSVEACVSQLARHAWRRMEGRRMTMLLAPLKATSKPKPSGKPKTSSKTTKVPAPSAAAATPAPSEASATPPAVGPTAVPALPFPGTTSIPAFPASGRDPDSGNAVESCSIHKTWALNPSS